MVQSRPSATAATKLYLQQTGFPVRLKYQTTATTTATSAISPRLICNGSMLAGPKPCHGGDRLYFNYDDVNYTGGRRSLFNGQSRWLSLLVLFGILASSLSFFAASFFTYVLNFLLFIFQCRFNVCSKRSKSPVWDLLFYICLRNENWNIYTLIPTAATDAFKWTSLCCRLTPWISNSLINPKPPPSTDPFQSLSNLNCCMFLPSFFFLIVSSSVCVLWWNGSIPPFWAERECRNGWQSIEEYFVGFGPSIS
jgi:hypothetical protein